MNTQEKTALESLISKLNSLRKTLNDDERKILDSMVVVDLADEVSLHSLPEDVVIIFDPETETYKVVRKSIE